MNRPSWNRDTFTFAEVSRHIVDLGTNGKIAYFYKGLQPQTPGVKARLSGLTRCRVPAKANVHHDLAGNDAGGHQETFVIASLSNTADDFFNTEACAVRRGSFR